MAAVLESLDAHHHDTEHLVRLLQVVATIARVAHNADAEQADGAKQVAEGDAGQPLPQLSSYLTQVLEDVNVACRSHPDRADSDDSDDGTTAEEFFTQRIAARREREAARGQFNGVLDDLEDTADGLAEASGDSESKGQATSVADASVPWDYRKRVVHANMQDVVASLMQRCHHFLGVEDAGVVLVGLDVLREGVQALKGLPKVLHPLLHTLWPSIVARLSHGNPGVQLRTVSLLVTLVVDADCGEFLGQRFVSGVWPKLEKALRQGCSWARVESLRVVGPAPSPTRSQDTREAPSQSRGQVMSAQNRLHHAILCGLARVAGSLNLRAEHGYQMVSACRPFLSSGAPTLLQDASVELVATLASVDYSCVWWAAVEMVACDSELVAELLARDGQLAGKPFAPGPVPSCALAVMASFSGAVLSTTVSRSARSNVLRLWAAISEDQS